MAKLWGGRFSGKTDPVMDAFNASIGFDRKLFEADIRGSQAYARATERQGILTPEESKAIQQGLDQIADEVRPFLPARSTGRPGQRLIHPVGDGSDG